MVTQQKATKFDDRSPLYYPTACCEVLHSSSAVYVSVVLQLVFSLLLLFLYFVLEKHEYIEATWIFRPLVYFLAMVNTLCNIFALYGVIMEQTSVIKYQILILIYDYSLRYDSAMHSFDDGNW